MDEAPDWLIVFEVAAALLIVINLARCNWVNREWDVWVAGSDSRFEPRLHTPSVSTRFPPWPSHGS